MITTSVRISSNRCEGWATPKRSQPAASILPLAGTVERDLAIDNNCHEVIALGIFELHDLMPAASQLPHRLGFSGFCSMASNSWPSTLNAAVFKCCRLVRRTGVDLPPTSTDGPVINCEATDIKSSASSISNCGSIFRLARHATIGCAFGTRPALGIHCRQTTAPLFLQKDIQKGIVNLNLAVMPAPWQTNQARS